MKRMLLLSLPLALLAGCASQSDVLTMQRDMDEMKGMILKSQKDVAGIRQEAQEGIDKKFQGSQKDLDAARKANADLQASLESMRVDLQMLAGKLDDAMQAAKKPGDDVALLKEDTERRFNAVDERLKALSQQIDDLAKKAAEAKPAQTPETFYASGLDNLKAGDMAKAREIFSRFLELYPKNDLAANARYWLGETYYQEKKFEQAILEFQEVIKNFPGKEKVAAAMLKQGMAFAELGDLKSARYVLKKLAEDYPVSDEAKKAKEKLKELK